MHLAYVLWKPQLVSYISHIEYNNHEGVNFLRYTCLASLVSSCTEYVFSLVYHGCSVINDAMENIRAERFALA